MIRRPNTTSVGPRWNQQRAVMVTEMVVVAITMILASSNHGSHSYYSTPHSRTVVGWAPPSSSPSLISVSRHHSNSNGKTYDGHHHHSFPKQRIDTAKSTITSSTAHPSIRQLRMKTWTSGTGRPDMEDDIYGIRSLLQRPPPPQQQQRQSTSQRSLIIRAMKSSSDDTTTSTDAVAFNPEKFLLPFVGLLATILAGICVANGYTVDDLMAAISHPQGTIRHFIETLKDMGPIGIIYFGLFYLIAETLAVPATPLALSAGYLFGFVNGFSVVLAAATAAACIGFVVGKTFLRSYVESILQENPKFAKIDRAVGQKGFKLLVLVRLSPIFPFSISNYIYGASSIDFVSYFWGTLLGFTPSTLAYVYTGMVGKEVMFGTTDGQPWYIYVAGFTVLLTLLKLVTDVATGIIEAIDDDDDVPQQ